MGKIKMIKNRISKLEAEKKVSNESVYDFISNEPEYYLLCFQAYLRKRGVDFISKIEHTSDLLDSPEWEVYREGFEAEARELKLKEFIK